MRLSVAMNGDDALLEGLSQHSCVEGVYGLSANVVGGGRSGFGLMTLTRQDTERHIQLAHQHGLQFNYVFNGTCLSNKEYTKETYTAIRDHLDWVSAADADWITVTIPYLIEVVKKYYPKIKVSASSFLNVESLPRARFLEDLGAEEITLRENTNRDFRLLEALRKGLSCQLQLIANHSCLHWCPFQTYHPNLMSHSSQSDHFSSKGVVDYCILSCSLLKISRPVEFVKSAWIRPEDLPTYEEIGIDKFKIVDRTKRTPWLLNTVAAYAARRCEGNLADILNIQTAKSNIPMNRDLIEPTAENLETIRALRGVGETLFSAGVHIDNRQLDGFLEGFLRMDCRTTSCDKCGYCARVAQRAVRTDEKRRQEAVERHEKILGALVAGQLAL